MLTVLREVRVSVCDDSGLEIDRFTIVLLEQEVVALPHYPIDEFSLVATLHQPCDEKFSNLVELFKRCCELVMRPFLGRVGFAH